MSITLKVLEASLYYQGRKEGTSLISIFLFNTSTPLSIAVMDIHHKLMSVALKVLKVSLYYQCKKIKTSLISISLFNTSTPLSLAVMDIHHKLMSVTLKVLKVSLYYQGRKEGTSLISTFLFNKSTMFINCKPVMDITSINHQFISVTIKEVQAILIAYLFSLNSVFSQNEISENKLWFGRHFDKFKTFNLRFTMRRNFGLDRARGWRKKGEGLKEEEIRKYSQKEREMEKRGRGWGLLV